MRLDTPRVNPLGKADWDEEVRQIFDRNGDRDENDVFNIFKTLAHHPKLMKRWMPFANHILFKSTLSPRDREIAILRIGWLCKAEYEWAQHVVIGKEAGLVDADIKAIANGPSDPHWGEKERLLLQAADELRADAFVSDATWNALAGHYSTQQLMDLVFTVANYNLVSMVLNSLGVQLDDGLEGFEATAGRAP